MVINQQVVAILRCISAEECTQHIACLLEYGINTVEITTNSPGWEISLQRIRQQFGATVQLGAGTVTTPEQVDICVAAGAEFILTPNLNPSVILQAKQQGLRVCAGVFTSSEIFSACELGVNIVKIFPACALPVNYPQLIKGPLSQPVAFSAVGGIDVENAADYLRYYDSVGLGSSLYKPGQRVAETAERCQLLLQNGK